RSSIRLRSPPRYTLFPYTTLFRSGKGSVNYLTERVDNDELKKKLLDKLQDFSVRIVLTAHPTQFYSGKVLGIINDLEDAIKVNRSEEHTSELQSRENLVCRLLLEK